MQKIQSIEVLLLAEKTYEMCKFKAQFMLFVQSFAILILAYVFVYENNNKNKKTPPTK